MQDLRSINPTVGDGDQEIFVCVIGAYNAGICHIGRVKSWDKLAQRRGQASVTLQPDSGLFNSLGQ